LNLRDFLLRHRSQRQRSSQPPDALFVIARSKKRRKDEDMNGGWIAHGAAAVAKIVAPALTTIAKRGNDYAKNQFVRCRRPDRRNCSGRYDV
jgi:hypothetical protein